VKVEPSNVPLVSVVIPMYQAEAWILETLASVAAQTYPRVETVVVDDGSTDEGVDLVIRYQELKPHAVQLIRTENHGVSDARNTGILASTGDYVAFLDADDLWHPRKLASQVACLEDREVVACVCGYELFADTTRRPIGVVQFRNGAAALTKWLALEGNGLLLPSTALVRRTAVNDLRGFDPEFSVSADLDFALRLEKLGPVIALSEVLVRYRVHHAQMHRNLGDLGSDVSLLYDQVFADTRGSSFERRCRANLDAHLGFSHLIQGHIASALPFLINSLRHDPRRLVTLPLRALARRLARQSRALFCSPHARWKL